MYIEFAKYWLFDFACFSVSFCVWLLHADNIGALSRVGPRNDEDLYVFTDSSEVTDTFTEQGNITYKMSNRA